MILDTYSNSNYEDLVKRRNELKKAVLNGKISEKRIDDSAKRILETKGYKVVN